MQRNTARRPEPSPPAAAGVPSHGAPTAPGLVPQRNSATRDRLRVVSARPSRACSRAPGETAHPVIEVVAASLLAQGLGERPPISLARALQLLLGGLWRGALAAAQRQQAEVMATTRSRAGVVDPQHLIQSPHLLLGQQRCRRLQRRLAGNGHPRRSRLGPGRRGAGRAARRIQRLIQAFIAHALARQALATLAIGQRPGPTGGPAVRVLQVDAAQGAKAMAKHRSRILGMGVGRTQQQ